MKKLLWLAIAIFTTEIIGIIGYYWLFKGYAGDISLTISRYVGLSPITSILFLIGNAAVSIITIIYMVNSKHRKFSWRFGYGMLSICLLMLSICPRLPENDQIIYIHRFFAAGMFLSLVLISYSIADLAKNKLARTFCHLYILYGFHFLIARLNNLPYLMNAILIWETAFIYGGFIIMIMPISSPPNKYDKLIP